MGKKEPVEVEKIKRMRPRDANSHRSVFGGEILKNMDEVGSIAAEKYAEEDVVTASINRMSFEEPVGTDDLLVLNSRVEYVGDTSITVGVEVYAEDIQDSTKRKTADAYLTYVAQDENGNNVSVPELDLQTDEGEDLYDAAEEMKEEAEQHTCRDDLPDPDSWDVEYPSRMRPKDSNKSGKVLGGEILKIMDEAASIAASRYARESVVTASLDTMSFEEPVYTDDLLIVNANVDYVGTSSMIISVDLHAEDLQTGDQRQTGRAYMTFVALDDSGSPTAVPELDPDTEDDEERYEAAEEFRQEILDDLDD